MQEPNGQVAQKTGSSPYKQQLLALCRDMEQKIAIVQHQMTIVPHFVTLNVQYAQVKTALHFTIICNTFPRNCMSQRNIKQSHLTPRCTTTWLLKCACQRRLLFSRICFQCEDDAKIEDDFIRTCSRQFSVHNFQYTLRLWPLSVVTPSSEYSARPTRIVVYCRSAKQHSSLLALLLARVRMNGTSLLTSCPYFKNVFACIHTSLVWEICGTTYVCNTSDSYITLVNLMRFFPKN